jgi:hypothetical protein
MDTALTEDQRRVLECLCAGGDPFEGCHERGHFGARMQVLAALRRAGLIDHHDHPLSNGMAAQVRRAA